MTGRFSKVAPKLAAMGFRVFPLQPGGKRPLLKGVDWTTAATTDADAIASWCGEHPDANVGIATGEQGDGRFLTAVDIDVKDGRDGLLSWQGVVDIYGEEPTLASATPSGGYHLFYWSSAPVRNSVDKIGPGIDVRSFNGYVVAPGSVVVNGSGEKRYRFLKPGSDGLPFSVAGEIATAPDHLMELFGSARPRRERNREGEAALLEKVDQERAMARARAWLADQDGAVEGAGGDITTYNVCCGVADFGITPDRALELLLEHWNPRCTPQWDAEDLREKVDNAYQYRLDPVGSRAPEAVFDAVPGAAGRGAGEAADGAGGTGDEHPVVALNAAYAMVRTKGGHAILYEYVDPADGPCHELMREDSFHSINANKLLQTGDGKSVPLTKLWKTHPDRRTYYGGLTFAPGLPTPHGYYNIWSGWAVDPLRDADGRVDGSGKGCRLFLEHLEEIVCSGNAVYFAYLIRWLAHMVQRPWELPQVGVILRGEKGTGKSIVGDVMSLLLPQRHVAVIDKRKHLTGNFNAALEGALLVMVEEAVWAGDKEGEGSLKHLTTGTKLTIERKGIDAYKITNYLRLIFTSNESWAIPATIDERRWFVLNVSSRRRQDRVHFKALWDQVSSEEGKAALLGYLMGVDLDGFDVGVAPMTKALQDQIEESMDPLDEWLLECLRAEKILGMDYSESWPDSVSCEKYRAAFYEYCDKKHVRGRRPTSRSIGRRLKKYFGILVKRRKIDGDYSYIFAPLGEMRARFQERAGVETG